MPPIDESFYRLPENPRDFSCIKYWRVYYRCVTFVGIFRGYYRDGFAEDCSLSQENFHLCMRAKTQTWEKASEEIKIVTARREKEWAKFNRSHIWKMRRVPPKARCFVQMEV
mmetsp:Transcript_29932/g.83673  ORF Transcript_29932/g.83673 Transcript_29932/m.83673 type:complete len:112 (+) Transcript_29932:58-393(+)